MSSEPLLSKIDLRDYYWISRDKLSSMQSNLLVPPVVKSLMTKLEPDGMAEKLTTKILNEELKGFERKLSKCVLQSVETTNNYRT